MRKMSQFYLDQVLSKILKLRQNRIRVSVVNSN